MPSLAKRLLGLLLAHPELVDSMGDQQLEVIDHGPIWSCAGLDHAGAIQRRAPCGRLAGGGRAGFGSGHRAQGLRADVLSQEDLPDPQTEWDDALRRIEFDSAKLEMAKLAAGGLATEERASVTWS